MSDTETAPRYPAEMGERLTRLETLADETRRSLERLERAIERLDAKLDRELGAIGSRLGQEVGGISSRLGQEVGGLRSEIATVRTQAWTQFAFLAAGLVGLATVMAHGFHWIL